MISKKNTIIAAVSVMAMLACPFVIISEQADAIIYPGFEFKDGVLTQVRGNDYDESTIYVNDDGALVLNGCTIHAIKAYSDITIISGKPDTYNKMTSYDTTIDAEGHNVTFKGEIKISFRCQTAIVCDTITIEDGYLKTTYMVNRCPCMAIDCSSMIVNNSTAAIRAGYFTNSSFTVSLNNSVMLLYGIECDLGTRPTFSSAIPVPLSYTMSAYDEEKNERIVYYGEYEDGMYTFMEDGAPYTKYIKFSSTGITDDDDNWYYQQYLDRNGVIYEDTSSDDDTAVIAAVAAAVAALAVICVAAIAIRRN